MQSDDSVGRKVDGRMTLIWILWKQVVRVDGRWNWVRFVSCSELWY